MFLKDKVVLITGASSGIGHALALACGKQGAKVVLAARRRSRLDSLHDDIVQAGGDALVVKTDVSDEVQVINAVESAMSHYGRIDILVNNAGYGMIGELSETPNNELKHIFSVNLYGVHYLCREVIPIMKKQGSGHIINIASVLGLMAIPYNGAYCATKFALIAYTESLRMELASSNIMVSAICPGPVRTEFMESLTNMDGRKIRDKQNLLWQTSEQLAHIILKCIYNPRGRVITSFVMKIWIAFHNRFPGLSQKMMMGNKQNLFFEN